MRHLLGLTLFFILLAPLSGNAQNSTSGYTVISNPNNITLSNYYQALEQSSLDRLRYADERAVLTFESGVVVELLSANEMQSLQLPVNLSEVRPVNVQNQAVFAIGSNGILIEKLSTPQTKK